MACEQYRDALTDAALGAPPAELAAHLERCARCRRELASLRSVVAAMDRGIAASVSGEPSPEFSARLRVRIEKAAQQPRWQWRWVPAAAGALAVLVLLVWLWSRPGLVPPHNREAAAPPLASGIRVPGQDTGARTLAAAGPSPGALRVQRSVGEPKLFPEVLIPREELEGFERLAIAAASGGVDPEAVWFGEGATQRLDPRQPLKVPEVRIKPLEIALLYAD